MVTYNLVHVAPRAAQLASGPSDSQNKIESLLLELRDGFNAQTSGWPKMLAYILDHKYSDANLRLDHMKGKDCSKARHLRAACESQDFCFFLANLELSREGGCDETYDQYDHYGGRYGNNWRDPDSEDEDEDDAEDEGEHHSIDEVNETTITFRTLFGDNGELIASNIALDEADIIQKDHFDGMPDEEEYEGYTGNAGASTTHIYRNTCIVLIPQQHRIPFLVEAAQEGCMNMEAWLDGIIEAVRRQPQNDQLNGELTHICELVIAANQAICENGHSNCRPYGWNRDPPFSDATLSTIVKAALQLQSPRMVESAVLAAEVTLPMNVYSTFGDFLAKNDLTQWQRG